jgi:hypothetical protein
MKMWIKAILGISLSFMCLFTCVGYAAISGNLMISGNVEANPPDYDEIVITDVVACLGTTATQTVSHVPPTNIKSKITGEAGDKIVYQIIAHNYSETETYVYTGPLYSDEYASVANYLTISASTDEQNTNKIPASSGANYYEGTPVAPGKEIVFYVTYTLNSNISASEIMVNFKFEPVIYAVTYLVNDEVYAVDCVVDNNSKYDVTRKYASTDASMEFDYWMNAGSSQVTSIPAGNTEDVNLYPSYVGVYTATFVDHNANIVAQDHFTRNNYSNITALGNDVSIRPVVEDCEFDYWQVRVTKNGTTTVSKLSDYKFTDNVDITIYPVYTYNGDVSLIPVDNNSDGVTDEYHVGGYKDPNGQDLVVIPDYVNGIPITAISASAFSSYEGVHSIVIPTTVTTASGNILAANWSFMDKGETVTIYYEGSYEQWVALEQTFTGTWDNGLGGSSRVFFLNGTDKVDVSQGYMQAKLKTNWLGTGTSIDWNHQATITSAIKNEYDNTCTCNDCNGADRPDRHYWTGVVIP